MQHNIPIDRHGAMAEPMAEAVESCVHCGFCLPTCPTYQVLGEEMDSPRGRIILMKEVLEGTLSQEEALPYLDPCLGCLACVTACPSGVQYGELITPFRAQAEESRHRPWLERMLRRFVLETLPYPHRFRIAATLGRFSKPLAKPLLPWLPERVGAMLTLLPDSLPASPRLPASYPAQGRRRAKVALLAGCAQQVLAPEINWASLRVLARNGVEVVLPSPQGCCGALSAHTGAMPQAQDFARKTLDSFRDSLADVDAIVTNAAGCGSGMQEYGLWLRGQPEETEAKAFAKRVVDISVFLADLGMQAPPPLPRQLTVAYHDACHLAHAQGVSVQPRQLLQQVEGLQLVDIADAEICCGSAGTYNIEQPHIANELGESKAKAVLDSGATMVLSGNIGCLTQLQNHLIKQQHPLPVYHTMQFLDMVYQQALPE